MLKKKKKQSAANEAATEKETAAMPVYTSRWEESLDDILTKLDNKEPFSYDPASDPAYAYHRDRYQKSGQLAMRDTMGQAAALTGGYGNSYAVSAGQSAYNATLAELGGVLGDLQESAYARYRDEQTDLTDRFAMLSRLRDADYDAYRDRVSDYYTDKELAYRKERDDIEDARYESETAYKQQQDAIRNDRLEKEYLEDKSRYDFENGIVSPLDYEGFTDADFGRYFTGIALLEGKSAAQDLIAELVRLNIINKGSYDHYRMLVENAY